MEIDINGKKISVSSNENTPLLWVIRDELNYTGTKFGCGQALCGACTIHVDGVPTRSCSFALKDAVGKTITTIEGMNGKITTAVQKAWVDNHVPQCGYCQSGQIMSAVALLRTNKKPKDSDISGAMSGNICRCGTYQRISAAIKQAAESLV